MQFAGKLRRRNMKRKAKILINTRKKEKKDERDEMCGEIQRQSDVWTTKMTEVLCQHLNRFGACIIDNFLGKEEAQNILDEVMALQQSQTFVDGRLARSQASSDAQIRSDKITWTDGIGPMPSPHLKLMINSVDNIVTGANKSPDRGALASYEISGRTRAMVACYPGQGSHYVKHVDNPNRDGRCITVIYYLNPDWRPETDGGALKIYSTCVEGVVAEVDPFFDRIIFFWSDQRNPHEVMPAYRDRYAITLWYIDENEKQKFEKEKGKTEMESKTTL